MGGSFTRAVCLKIGIWNGAQTVSGQLLYHRLLSQAMHAGMRGATFSTHIEGSQRSLGFRSVGSEVGSNELPLWLEIVDREDRWPAFITDARRTIGRHGLIVSEVVDAHSRQQGGEAEKLKQSGTTPRQFPTREGLQVQVYSLEGNRIDGKPVYQVVTEFLRAKNIFWISTARGLCGFGDGRRIHKARWFSRSAEIPIVMTVVDFTEQLSPHLDALAQLVGDQGLVSVRPVMWLHPSRP